MSAKRKRSNLLNSLFQGYLKLKEMYPILKALLKFCITKNLLQNIPSI